MLTERLAAYEALHLWETKEQFISRDNLSPFAVELATGVCRRKLFLEYAIRQFVKKKPRAEIGTILKMGFYQLFFMDSVPNHAAIHTSVEMVRKLRFGEFSARFVNGVLRQVSRSGLPELKMDSAQAKSLWNSIPEFLYARLEKTLGSEGAEKFASRHLKRPVWYLRVNTNAVSPCTLAEYLKIPPTIKNERYLRVPPEIPLKQMLASPYFQKGFFSVQNPAAANVIKMLRVHSGMHVWDACAAPGGKTALLAEINPDIQIFATDISEKRCVLMNDLFLRCHFQNVKTACLDASEKIPTQSFDRILLDVPCSNLGVIDKRPEAVYRISKESLRQLNQLQYKILENASRALLPGGILVYATCSPDASETTTIIYKFLKKHPDFSLVGEPFFAGSDDEEIDKFFAAALQQNRNVSEGSFSENP